MTLIAKRSDGRAMLRAYKRLKGARTGLKKIRMFSLVDDIEDVIESLEREMNDLDAWMRNNLAPD